MVIKFNYLVVCITYEALLEAGLVEKTTWFVHSEGSIRPPEKIESPEKIQMSMVWIRGLYGIDVFRQHDYRDCVSFPVDARTAIVMGQVGWVPGQIGKGTCPTRNQWNSFLEAYVENQGEFYRKEGYFGLKSVDPSGVLLHVSSDRARRP